MGWPGVCGIAGSNRGGESVNRNIQLVLFYLQSFFHFKISFFIICLWGRCVSHHNCQQAERLFISRGFTFTQLHAIPQKCDPAARQKKQQGHTVSFPQQSASLLTMLPLHVDRAREFLTVYFTGPDRAVVRTQRQYVVRRSKVEKALQWLRVHNRAYADIVN